MPQRLLTLAFVLLLISPQSARAEIQSLSLRSSLNLALMVSSDQVQRLAYDQPGVLGTLYGGYALARNFELRAGMVGGPFFSKRETGGLLAGCVGARVLAPGRKVAPYAAVDLGGAATGELVRPWFELSVGLDLALTQRIGLGPTLAYQRLLQWNGPRFSSDASSFAFGASLVYKFVEEPPPVKAAPRQPPRVVPTMRRPEPEPVPEPSADVLALIERALPSSAVRVELLAPVLFAFDSAELEPTGTAMLHETAATLKARPEIELVEVRGYADGRGPKEYNQELALRRAEKVRAWLVEHGVAESRLTLAAHGAADFVEQGEDEPAHAQNRRVVFRILRELTP